MDLVVAVDDALYVRAYNGTAAGLTKEVVFESVTGPLNERIDEAYRAKYGSNPYLSPMIGTRARAATVKVMPRDTDSVKTWSGGIE